MSRKTIMLAAVAASLTPRMWRRSGGQGQWRGYGFVVGCGEERDGPPRDWNAADACAVVDQEGGDVGDPRAGGHRNPAGQCQPKRWRDRGHLECSYQLADGGSATLMLRWSPIGDNSEGSINLTRNGLEQTLKGFGGHPETIDGLGKAACWAGMTRKSLRAVGEVGAIITVPASEALKEQAVALAQAWCLTADARRCCFVPKRDASGEGRYGAAAEPVRAGAIFRRCSPN